MTTAVFARASRMADQVKAESKDVDLAKTLVTLLLLVPLALGWLAGALWTAVSWSWAAAVVGFRTAAPARTRPDEPS